MTNLGFAWVEWPYARIRRELDTNRGHITRFVYQLEYNVTATEDGFPPNDWREVARFDHDIDGQHDVSEEGLHLDIYRNGVKYKTTRDFPAVPLNQAPVFCMEYLQQNADYFIDRFECWHDVGERWK